MTTGRIVEHDRAADYWLPPGHAAWLTRPAGMDNLAAGMQYIGPMALVKTRSSTVPGTAAGSRTRVPADPGVMAEDNGAVRDATLIDVTLPLVPGMARGQAGHRGR